MVWVLTLAFISPVVGKPVLLATRAVFAALFSMPGRLAGDNAIRNPRRTGATASALMIGLTLVSAVGVLAASLSAQTTKLVDEQFTADFLVTSVGFGTFPVAIGEEMAQVEGVTTVSHQQGRWRPPTAPGPAPSPAVDDAFDDVYTLDVLSGTQKRRPARRATLGDPSPGLDRGRATTWTSSSRATPPCTVTVVGVFEDCRHRRHDRAPCRCSTTRGCPAPTTPQHPAAWSPTTPRAEAAMQVRPRRRSSRPPIVTVQDKEQFTEGVTGQVNQLLFMIYGLLALSVVIAVIGIVNTLSLTRHRTDARDRSAACGRPLAAAACGG